MSDHQGEGFPVRLVQAAQKWGSERADDIVIRGMLQTQRVLQEFYIFSEIAPILAYKTVPFPFIFSGF
jgi:hypothetical protein